MMLVRARSKTVRTLIVLTIIASGFSVSGANAYSGAGAADPGLSTNVGFGGTGERVKTVRTDALRNEVPGDTARILIIGSGVERALFPAGLSIEGIGRDLTDPYGYGTLAASVIHQLLPGAQVTSKAVRSHDAGYNLLRMDELRDALGYARANADRFDLVLLAYPPQAALDPISHVAGHGNYKPFGTGLDLVAEALLTNPNAIAGIPADRGLREEAFAGLNLKQRDAMETYVKQASAWNNVLDVLGDLDRAGVPVVAPSGDYAIGSGNSITPLPTQTIFGLSAEESVITVGASYADGSIERVSPTSGRGPTLALEAKPDLIAPSDVLGLLPRAANLSWPDDSLRAPLSIVHWAKQGTPPTPCPSLDGAYRCVLQGSSMISASVVAANLAASVANGVPSVRANRTAQDDEAVRGIAWAQASQKAARASDGSAPANVWAQGAGVFTGLRGLDASTTPVVLARPHLGEVSFTRDAERSVPLWTGGAAATGTATITSLTGPEPSGATVVAPMLDRDRIRVEGAGFDLTVRAPAGRHQGGLYAGALTLTSAAGPPVSIPLSVTQTLPLDFKATYAYNELLARGEGERVEDSSLLLFAGLPNNVGLIGTAFKNLTGKAFKNVGGDPTNNYILRTARTRNSFREDIAPAEHGTGSMPSVPPGFYKFHLLADHGFDARQERGRGESIGIRLGTFGPDTALVPGASLLVPSQPACDGGDFSGPFDGCLSGDGTADPATGFCTMSNTGTKVAFNVYCQPISFAVPGAVASRAVHLIEHDKIPARSEWTACGIDVPIDGKRVDLAALAGDAENCQGSATVPTAWSFETGARGCLSPEERSAFPGGHPTDVTATYSGAAAPGLPGRNFPVAVLNYRFKLPQPNTYTTAALSLSYVADNAIVGTRFVTGTDRLADASTGILVVDDPDVAVSPALKRPASEGSAFTEWAVMSANATHGTLSLFIIPTAWVRPDLNPAKPIASVQLCDVALRVNTFAKQSYGAAATNGIQTSAFTDNALLDQIDPATSRVRPVHDGSGFTGVGVERESLTIAVHVPKNTTHTASAHRVLSPVGGPASLSGARAASGGNALRADYLAHDPGFGISNLDCSKNPDLADLDIDRNRNAAVCTAFMEARSSGDVVAELTPDVMVNGRFYGVLALDHAALTRSAADVLVDVTGADDGGAFESRWARKGSTYDRLFPVSDFYDDAVPLPLSPLSGIISIARDAKGNPILTVDAAGVGGVSHRITSPLE
jgi:hypothetical protein